MQQTTEITELETNDLGLVTYLKLHGHSHYETRWRERTHYWIFHIDDDVDRLYENWLNHRAIADVRQYNGVYGTLKRELFEEMRKRGLFASRP